MIHYSLRCTDGHGFDGWFASAGACDDQASRGLLRCPECGTAKVDKAPMAPSVRATAGPTRTVPSLTAPANDRERRLADLRREIEKNSEYVGMNFATEARRIHDGDAPGRSIHGEAKSDEARALIEDGVPVAPLPFMPTRKTN